MMMRQIIRVLVYEGTDDFLDRCLLPRGVRVVRETQGGTIAETFAESADPQTNVAIAKYKDPMQAPMLGQRLPPFRPQTLATLLSDALETAGMLEADQRPYAEQALAATLARVGVR